MNKVERILAEQMWKYRHGKWWMPDKWYVELLYERLMDSSLNLRYPERLTEKLQWIKLYDHKPIYTVFADKFLLKEWVKEHIGEAYVVPTLATYSNVEEIDIDKLPNEFVIKCNHDSGSVFICYNKVTRRFVNKEMQEYSWDEVKAYLAKAVKKQYYYESREWPYKDIKRLIFVEPIVTTKNGHLPNDIKLFFANGQFLFTYVSYGRDGVNDRCTYDQNWERLPFVWMSPHSYREGINTSDVPRPEQYDKMKEIGAQIAAHCKFCRVDFYDVDGDTKIGDVTFFHGGGFDKFFPEKYDLIYGEKLKLD